MSYIVDNFPTRPDAEAFAERARFALERDTQLFDTHAAAQGT